MFAVFEKKATDREGLNVCCIRVGRRRGKG